MRGRPLLQLILFACLWTSLIYVIAFVTGPGTGTHDTTAPPAERVDSVPAWLSMRFSEVPANFRLLQDGKELWAEDSPADTRFDGQVELSLAHNAVELFLSGAVRSEDTAVEITLEPDGLDAVSGTMWVDGPFEEVFRFSWGDRD